MESNKEISINFTLNFKPYLQPLEKPASQVDDEDGSIEIDHVRYFHTWLNLESFNLEAGQNGLLRKRKYFTRLQNGSIQLLKTLYKNNHPIDLLEHGGCRHKRIYLIIGLGKGQDGEAMMDNVQVETAKLSTIDGKDSLLMLDRINSNQSMISLVFVNSRESCFNYFYDSCNCNFKANFKATLRVGEGGGNETKVIGTKPIEVKIEFDFVKISQISVKRLAPVDISVRKSGDESNEVFEPEEPGDCLLQCHACLCNENERNFKYEWSFNGDFNWTIAGYRPSNTRRPDQFLLKSKFCNDQTFLKVSCRVVDPFANAVVDENGADFRELIRGRKFSEIGRFYR